MTNEKLKQLTDLLIKFAVAHDSHPFEILYRLTFVLPELEKYRNKIHKILYKTRNKHPFYISK